MKYVLILLSLLILSSCHDVKKQGFLSDIKEMNETLDQLEKDYDLIDLDSVNSFLNQINAINSDIHDHYETDTINVEMGRKMNEFKRTRNKLRSMGKMGNQVFIGKDEERVALKNLHEDIENGAGDRSKYEEHINFEKKKVNQLRILMDETLKSKEEIFPVFYELQHDIKLFAEKQH